MNYEEIYCQVIEKLKCNERPKIRLTDDLLANLKTEWQNAISKDQVDESKLKKIFCILDNTHNLTPEFNELFIASFEKIRDHQLLIYALAASQKHVIEESLRSGNMISSDYFLKIKGLLKSKNPEVVEWTLRTIDSMGPFSLRFASDVRAIKPGFFKFLNKHQKSSSQLIALMEKQWEKMRS